MDGSGFEQLRICVLCVSVSHFISWKELVVQKRTLGTSGISVLAIGPGCMG